MLTRVSAQRHVEHEEVPVNWSILISAINAQTCDQYTWLNKFSLGNAKAPDFISGSFVRP